MTVRASNDNGTGEPTLAPKRSSLPKGYRSGPPAVWMDHSIQILKDNRNRTHSKWGSDSFYQFGDLRSTSNCLGKTSRQSPCSLRCFKIQGVAATQRKFREASLAGADGVVHIAETFQKCISERFRLWNHPVSAFGASTPPHLGGDTPTPAEPHSETFSESISG